MLVLRAVQHDPGVFDRPHAVAGGSVKEVVLLARVDLAVRVHHHLKFGLRGAPRSGATLGAHCYIRVITNKQGY